MNTQVRTRSHVRDEPSDAMVLTHYVARLPQRQMKTLQEIEINYDTVNQPVDPEEFTLAGFDLPAGTVVMDLTKDPHETFKCPREE